LRKPAAIGCANGGGAGREIAESGAWLRLWADMLVSMAELVQTRQALVQRGKRLEYFTIAWNSLEGIVAVVAGVIAGSISLVGFGVDSFIEVTSGAALLWRMSIDAEEHRRERIEKMTLRIVGACFLALAVYVGYEAVTNLMGKKAPEHSLAGIILACASLVVMPLLSRAKRRVAARLKSAAMNADAKQTEFCTYLSAILLGGLLLNAVADLWWADAIAGLIMVPIIAKESVDGLRGDTCCD
jgi:divalent metal cation (Fe/Co/Zn/Cd) transporter